MRRVAYAHENLVADEPNPRDGFGCVSVSTGLMFCPFYGTRVDRLLRASPQHFKELAAQHDKFADDNLDRPCTRRRKT